MRQKDRKEKWLNGLSSNVDRLLVGTADELGWAQPLTPPHVPVGRRGLQRVRGRGLGGRGKVRRRVILAIFCTWTKSLFALPGTG